MNCEKGFYVKLNVLTTYTFNNLDITNFAG